jgi:hypothetical protein
VTNAVERLWAALAAGDRHRAATELHDRVILEWPHSGQRFEGPEAYLEAYEALPGLRAIETRRVVTQGRHVASEVRLEAEAASWAVASFFTLHDGRILHATEYWVRRA